MTRSLGGKRDTRAIKRIQKELLTEEDHEEVFNEFMLLKQMDHPNIAKMFEFFEDQDDFWFVQEYCSGGELLDELERIDTFPEAAAGLIMKQVVSSVHYCHNQKHVVHRDLKLENILLEEGPQQAVDAVYKPMIVKVIDFGLATTFSKGQVLSSPVGSMHYIAPEVLECEYNYKCDLWSCGVIAFILLCGYAPFEADTDADMRELIMMGLDERTCFLDPAWDCVSQEAKDFVLWLLTYEPDKRPDTAQALQHPWIQNVSRDHAQQFRATKIGTDAAVKCLTNCRSFEAASKLKQATCAFMVSQLALSSGEEEQGAGSSTSADFATATMLGEIFRAMDLDADGRLSPKEWRIGFQDFLGDSVSAPLTVEEVDDIFRRMDLSSSGFIDYSEFVVACMGLHNQEQHHHQKLLKLAFERLLDKDGSGFISHDKLRKEMAPFYGEDVEEAIIQKIIDQVDADNDGQISWSDFEAMMSKTADFVAPEGATLLCSDKEADAVRSKSPAATSEPSSPSKSKPAITTPPELSTLEEVVQVPAAVETVKTLAKPRQELEPKTPIHTAKPQPAPERRKRPSVLGPKARLISAMFEKNLEKNRAMGMDPFSFFFRKQPQEQGPRRRLPRTRRINFEELMKKANAQVKFGAREIMEGRNAEIEEFKATNPGVARERRASLVHELHQEKQDAKREVRLHELEDLKNQHYSQERRSSLQNSFQDCTTRRLELQKREQRRRELEEVKKSMRDDSAAKKRLFESWHQANLRASKAERRSSQLKAVQNLQTFHETFEVPEPLTINSEILESRRSSMPTSAALRRPGRRWTRHLSGRSHTRESIKENAKHKIGAENSRPRFDRTTSHAVLQGTAEYVEERLVGMQPKAKTKKSARLIEPIRRLNSFDSDHEQDDRDERLNVMAPVEASDVVPQESAGATELPRSPKKEVSNLPSRRSRRLPTRAGKTYYESPAQKQRRLEELQREKATWQEANGFSPSSPVKRWFQKEDRQQEETLTSSPVSVARREARLEELRQITVQKFGGAKSVRERFEKTIEANKQQQQGSGLGVKPQSSATPRSMSVTVCSGNDSVRAALESAKKRNSIGVVNDDQAQTTLTALKPDEKRSGSITFAQEEDKEESTQEEHENWKSEGADFHKDYSQTSSTQEQSEPSESSRVSLSHDGDTGGEGGLWDSVGVSSEEDHISPAPVSPKRSKKPPLQRVGTAPPIYPKASAAPISPKASAPELGEARSPETSRPSLQRVGTAPEARSPKPSNPSPQLQRLATAPELGSPRRPKFERPAPRDPNKKIVTPKNLPRFGSPVTSTKPRVRERLSVRPGATGRGVHLTVPARRASASATMMNPDSMTEEQKAFLRMAKNKALKSKLAQ